MSQNSPDQEVPLKFDEAKLDSTAVTDEIEYEQKESAESNKDGSDTILFVGGLDEKTTNDQLKFYFEKFGEVEDANIIVDWVTGKSKRCALIFCSTPERKKVRVCKADSKKRGTKIIRAKILHLSQIHPSISAQELESYIQTFGAIKKLRLTPLLNPGIFSKSRHGYLELVNEEDCKKLLEHRRCLSINNFKFQCTPFRNRTENEAELVSMISSASDEEILRFFELYELTSQETDIQENLGNTIDPPFDFSQMKFILDSMLHSQQGGFYNGEQQFYSPSFTNNQYPTQMYDHSYHENLRTPINPPASFNHAVSSHSSPSFGPDQRQFPPTFAPYNQRQQQVGPFYPQSHRPTPLYSYPAPYYTPQHQHQAHDLYMHALRNPAPSNELIPSQYISQGHIGARAHYNEGPQVPYQLQRRDGYLGTPFYPSHNQPLKKRI